MNTPFAIKATEQGLSGKASQAVEALAPTSAATFFIWRAFDIIVALSILVVALPFLLILAAIMYLSDPGPIFFVHERIGHRARKFGCIKFRTMKVNGDAILKKHLTQSPEAQLEWEKTRKLRKDPRVTAVGCIVRKLSLDEFPQLFNVLRGEMSIAGPRPIVEAEIQRYGRFFEHYCHVKPGLTGLWQISGRNDVSYDERVKLDVRYVLSKSLALDTWLLIKTVPAVVFARGSY